MSLFRELGAGRKGRDGWIEGLEAVVAVNEDPEFQHRIKVVIPLLDEHQVYDKWVRSLCAFVLGPGYGSFFVPPVGSEVTLFARLGAKHNLFYTPAYNEDFIVPPDFRDTAVSGFRVPGAFKIISEAYMQLQMSRGVIEADSGSIQIKAPAGVFINGREY